ncbi:hypothetical protein FA10DRAFT_267726 [Acaromyces ingoldii]|uniref:Blue (type 1) copper domain-containing protein n=1 Tax=Acaromyces ingoldii TaxID=215250 RepID=A0A316YIW9_9BASI|nr:hypothetical protein FA10DRAFT_267726 [Acaromyces ingoldii]PWN89131.1 hypothetical protein FA10DRAFT_267726 [Acaromyces ingoldii]
MLFVKTLLSVSAFAASQVMAATQMVQVGQDGGYSFAPNTVTAGQGDTVVFQFHASIHNVVQSAGSDAAGACQRGAFGTAIMMDGTSYTLPINSTDPVYIHCGPHCQSEGMVMVINPPSANTFAQFQSAATGQAASSSSSSAPAATSSAAGKSDGASLGLDTPSRWVQYGAVGLSLLVGAFFV